MKEPNQPTFKQALQYLFSIISWRLFGKRECVGKLVYYKGKKIKVIMETYENFYLEGIDKAFLKSDYAAYTKVLKILPRNMRSNG